MNANIINLVEEAMKDQAFVHQLADAETVEAAQKVFATRGIEFTLDEVKAIASGLKATNESGELTDSDLENVAGGVGVLAAIASVVGIISGIVSVVDFAGKRFGWWK